MTIFCYSEFKICAKNRQKLQLPTWCNSEASLFMTGLFRDMIMEFVLIFLPSLKFSSKFPCTGEFMCALPKLAGTLMSGAIIFIVLANGNV